MIGMIMAERTTDRCDGGGEYKILMKISLGAFAMLLSGAYGVGYGIGPGGIEWRPDRIFDGHKAMAYYIGEAGLRKIRRDGGSWPKYLAYSEKSHIARCMSWEICGESQLHPGLQTIDPMKLQCNDKDHSRVNVVFSRYYQPGEVWLVVENLHVLALSQTLASIAKLRQRGFTVNKVFVLKEGTEKEESDLTLGGKVTVVKLLNAKRIVSMLKRANSLPCLYRP